MEDCIYIEGKKRLSGEITVQGSKNASLPLIASCVALGDVRVIKNVPKITDVYDLLKIFTYFGVKYTFVANELTIDSTNVCQLSEENAEILFILASKIRSSTYMIGALLRRLKYLVLPKPGGCKIGTRPIDIHLDGLKAFGCEIKEKEFCYEIGYTKSKACDVRLRYPSVGATINLCLFAMFNDKKTIIDNVAIEPEVDAVIKYLNLSGRKIEKKENCLTIYQSDQIKNNPFYNPFDRIILGDLLLATASTHGDIVIDGINPVEIKALIRKISKSPCNLYIKNDKIMYSAMGRLRGCVFTDPYPRFPTDLQAQFVCAVLGSGGRAVVKENVFGSRFEYAKQLSKMGANVRVHNRYLIANRSQLHSAVITCPDLRGGAGLVIASLCASGQTQLNNLHIIERGYEDIAEMYNRLGASIKRSK